MKLGDEIGNAFDGLMVLLTVIVLVAISPVLLIGWLVEKIADRLFP